MNSTNATLRSSSRRFAWFALVPLAAGWVATAMYLLQGGLGTGHDRFHRAIPLLELPSSLVLAFFEPPAVLEQFPLMLYIWLPTLANALVWVLAARAWSARRATATA